MGVMGAMWMGFANRDSRHIMPGAMDEIIIKEKQKKKKEKI